MEYQWQKRRPEGQEKSPSRQSDTSFGGGFMGGIPNSAMLDMLESQRAAMENQIPAAEQEADRLSAGVRASSPDALKAAMSARLGADFSDVRFHTDADAAQRAERMGARAWTQGRDVYFGAGGFDPTVAAHELVHTAQQGAVEAGTPTMSIQSGTVQMWPKWMKNFKNWFRRKKDFENTEMPVPANYRGPDAEADARREANQPLGSLGTLDDSFSIDDDEDAMPDEVVFDNDRIISSTSELFHDWMNMRDEGGSRRKRDAASKQILNSRVDNAFSSLHTDSVEVGGLRLADPELHTSLVNQSAHRIAKGYRNKNLTKEEAQQVMAEEGAKYQQAMDNYRMSDEKKQARAQSDEEAYQEMVRAIGEKDVKNMDNIYGPIHVAQLGSRKRRDQQKLWMPKEAANRANHSDVAAHESVISTLVSRLGRVPTKEEYLSMEKMTMEYPQWVKLLLR